MRNAGNPARARAVPAGKLRALRGADIWWVFALLPVISAAYGTFNFMQNREILTNGWYSLFTQHTLFYALFFFSPMVGVYAAYLWRMEHIGGGMNLLMTMPVRPFCFFAAKGAAVLAVTLLTQGWVYALYVLCGRMVCGAVLPAGAGASDPAGRAGMNLTDAFPNDKRGCKAFALQPLLCSITGARR